MTYVYFQVERDAKAWLEVLRDQGFRGYVLSVSFGTFEVRYW